MAIATDNAKFMRYYRVTVSPVSIMGEQDGRMYSFYYGDVEQTLEDTMASELPKLKLNLKGIRDYARKKAFQSPVF